MKVCIVVPYFTPYVRGNEYGLAESLTRLGYEVTIIASKAKAPREIKKDFPAEFPFEVKYLPTFVNIGDNPLTWGLHIEDYDVALLQEDYPFICHRAYTEAKSRGIKTILSTERTYYPAGLKGTLLRILDKGKNKELREGVDLLTAHCTAAKEFMERVLGVTRAIEVIPVGVDTALFRPMEPQERYLPGRGFKILTVARLHRYKGLEYVITALRFLREQHRAAMLYILGSGPEEEYLKRTVKRLGLEQAVTFLHTSLPNYEMPLVYNECDVYVQPSIIEPYGIAVVEAMACGKPVIGTRVGGMSDTIKDGETGFIVAPGNAEELAERIAILMDEKKRVELGLRARKWVVEHFEWRVIGQKYHEVIVECAGTGG